MKLLSYFFVLTSLSAVTVYATPIFKYAELQETTSFTLPADTAKEKSVGGSVGGRLVFGNAVFSLDARSYTTLPKTKFSVLQDISSLQEMRDTINDVRFGAGGTLNTRFPLVAKVGMLSFSKSVTRLKNPTPSASANPLAKSFGFSAGIGANLPTLSSSVKPFAAFASISVPQKQFRFPLALQFAWNDEHNSIASLSASARPSKFVTLQSVLTAGHFIASADNTTRKLLTDTNAFFTDADQFAASWETAFRSPFLKANLFVGFHQTPFSAAFSPYALWIKTATRTTYRNLLLDLSYFAIPTLSVSPKPIPLIGADATICRTVSQWGINPQVQYSVNNAYAATVRVGFHSLIEKKILNTLAAEQYSTLKWSAGFTYESKPFTAKLTVGASNIILDGRFLTDSTTPDKYYSADMTTSLALASVKAAFSAGYDRYPKSVKTGDTKDSFSVDASLSPGKARILTCTSGFSRSYKNGEKSSASINASATIKLKRTWTRTTIKCAVSMPL